MTSTPTIKREPCGCATTTLPDGRKLFAPCVPCGLMRAATELSRARRWWRRSSALENAAQALAAVASTIRREALSRLHASRAVSDLLSEKNKP